MNMRARLRDSYALLVLSMVSTALAGELEVVTSVGFDTGAPVDGPTSLTFDEFGNLFVLSQKANAVSVFDADLRFVRSIGRQGGGPGELQNTACIALHQERLYVATMGRTHVFSVEGEYEASISSLYFSKLSSIGGELVAISSKEGPTFARLDGDLRVLETFGPPSDWRKEWKILPGPDSGFVAFERHDGHAVVIDESRTNHEVVDLGLGRGWWKGARGKHALADVAFDRVNQRYLVLYYPQLGEAPYLVECGPDLSERTRWRVPEELGADEVAVDPAGRIFVSSYGGSMVHVVRPDDDR